MKKFLLAFASIAASLNIMAQIGVGIDETSPASKFAVKGNLAVGNGYTTTAAPADGAIIKGRVGIGTTNPTKMLSVFESGVTDPTTVHDGLLINADYGTNPATTANAGGRWGIHFTGAAPGIYTTQKSVGLYAVSEDPLGYNRQLGMSFWVSDLDVAYVERMRIDHTGNVGIGIAAPTQKLDVAGNINTSGNITATGTVRGGAYALLGTGITGGYYQDVTNGAYRAIVPATTTTGFYLQSNAGTTTTMYVGLGGTYDGRVGIGTLGPSQKLDVQGGSINTSGNVTASGNVSATGVVTAGASAVMGTGIAGGYYQDATNGAYRAIVSAATTTGYYFQSNAGNTTTMYVGLGGSYNNNVGIRTNSPMAPLHVAGSSGSTNAIAIKYINQANQLVNANNSWSGGVTIFSEGDILGTGSVICTGNSAFSDKRIKNVIGVSNSKQDFETLNKIAITKYKYIDTIGVGNAIHTKVIAQQVEQVYPEAVKQIVSYIPDVYALANEVSYNKATGEVTITIEKEHLLTTANKVKLIGDDGNQIIAQVKAVNNAYSFTIESNVELKKVFVYGKEVNDLRVVDYEALSMLNISAVQELSRMVKTLSEENEQLKTALKEKAGANDMNQLKSQLDELKLLMEKNGIRSEK